VLAGIAAGQTTAADLIALLAHFRANRRLAAALLVPPTRAVLSRSLASLIAANLPPHPDTGVLPALRAQFLAEGQLALVEAHTLGRPPSTAAQTAAALLTMTTLAA
jgi:hypothetical protein